MKRLNEAKIHEIGECLSFTTDEAREIAEIFFSEKKKGNIRLRCTELETVKDYIKEYENNWYRYSTWKKLIDSELDMGEDGLTSSECETEKGISIFHLSSGMYIQTAY